MWHYVHYGYPGYTSEYRGNQYSNHGISNIGPSPDITYQNIGNNNSSHGDLQNRITPLDPAKQTQAQLINAQLENARLAQKVENLQNVNALRTENDELYKKLSRQTIEELQRSRDAYIESLTVSEQIRKEQEQTIQNQKTQLTLTSDKLNQLIEDLKNKKIAFTQKTHESKLKNKALKQEINVHKESLKVSYDTIHRLEEELKNNKKELSEKLNAAEEINRKQNQQIADHEQQQKKSVEEIQKIKADNEEVKASALLREVEIKSKAEEQLEKRDQKLRKLERKNKRLKRKLEKWKNSSNNSVEGISSSRSDQQKTLNVKETSEPQRKKRRRDTNDSTNKANKKRWTLSEDKKLLELRDTQKLTFTQIEEQIPGRTWRSCEIRYSRLKRKKSSS